MPTLGGPVPILRSFDAGRTRVFYLDFQGFAPVFEHRFAPDLPLYVGVRHGDCVLRLSEHHGDATPGSAIRIPVDDVFADTAHLRSKHHSPARPGDPESTPWNTHEVTITDPATDPAGNRLTFFTEIAHG